MMSKENYPQLNEIWQVQWQQGGTGKYGI